ncbi:zinc transporter ZupT [Thermanaerosceptrum fracticalcis]|uniref:zinc transporter ZupT n=1 Tax=Thermanaerosceptrum fracticalcis TaxID=1712410 RepID=UPI000ADCDF0E|nr:zinc transporter ZupT [Thermanaerosceptrum fracticalcis]
MYDDAVLLAFGLTLFAGLSTGIGSLIALLAKKTNTAFLSVSLGFSGGVMVYISFVEILTKSREILTAQLGIKMGPWCAVLAFFAGMLLIAIIDSLVPEFENPHEIRKVEEIENRKKKPDKERLLRMGLFSALAIAIHNFPEGLATFTAALNDPTLGIGVAIAVAIHNIPEGVAVSIPVYYATGSRKKAFLYSFLSGLSEPLGALLGIIALKYVMSELIFGLLFAAVAGIMIFISFDELLPASREYGGHHLSLYGLVAGMAVMAVSLLLFA